MVCVAHTRKLSAVSLERSAALAQGTEIPGYTPGQFVQFIADNVDHNVRSIDGHGTFHGMGIISTSTPGPDNNTTINVPRASVTKEQLTDIGRIPIEYYTSVDGVRALASLKYDPLPNFIYSDTTSHLDVLWKTSLLLKRPRPAWNGFMQITHKGDHPGKSSIHFLPMIDMDPTNMTCIYSTLKFVCKQAGTYGFTPIITFDQPLWWKATTIVLSEPDGSDLKSMIIRLGSFHIMMSFLGSIGSLMSGSGLKEVLQVAYAENAVTHMLSGKAISRAIRGHLLVYAALYALITSHALGVPLPSDAIIQPTESMSQANDAGMHNHNEMEIASDILQGLLHADTNSEMPLEQHACLKKIDQLLEQTKNALSTRRTAKLWLQYLSMVEILQKFIKAERIGDWQLHLHALSEMLPFFAVAGHFHYAKSSRLSPVHAISRHYSS